MHGTGNDFIMIDGRGRELADMRGLARKLCHRRFGVGADQILILGDSSEADFSMRIFNADGSEVEMCGNGIRCFAKYVWDRGLSDADPLTVETQAGIIRPARAGDLVRVDMGEPQLDGRKVPVNLDGFVKDYPLPVLDREFRMTCVSMGNPHAVIFVDRVDGFPVETYGPVIERHELFPRRTNVEFIEVIGRERLRMRVWERGAGETLACGTGACAAAVAAHLNGHAGRKVEVELLGGVLSINWREDNRVFMTGPAVEVFEGAVEA
jgi:diaminopimelate epimerase